MITKELQDWLRTGSDQINRLRNLAILLSLASQQWILLEEAGLQRA